jgi:hypothetical protein
MQAAGHDDLERYGDMLVPERGQSLLRERAASMPPRRYDQTSN